MQKTGDLLGIGLQGVGLGQIVGREAAAHVDHLQDDAVLVLQPLEDHLDLGDGAVPGTDIALL